MQQSHWLVSSVTLPLNYYASIHEEDTGGDYHQGCNLMSYSRPRYSPEQVDGAGPAADPQLGPRPDGGHAVQLGLVHLGLDVGPPRAEVEALDRALAAGGQQVVIVNLEEGGHVLVKPLVGHHRGVVILSGVPHLDEAILVPGDRNMGVQAVTRVEGGVVTLHILGP